MAEVKSPKTNKWVWLVAVVLGLAAATLGFSGYACMLAKDHEKNPDAAWNHRDAAYGALGLFVINNPPWNEVNWRLEAARFLAPAATGFAGFAAVYTLFNEQIWAWRVKRSKGHVVVCGLGEMGFAFVQNLHSGGRRVVVVETDAAKPAIEECRELRIPVIIGDAQHGPILRRAGVEGAEWLISVCNGDSVNTEVLLTARTIATTRTRARDPLHCLAQVENLQLSHMLRAYQIHQHDSPNGDGELTWLADFFNTDDTAAALILNRYPVEHAEDQPPHIVIAQLDSLGERVLLLAVRRWLAERRRSDSTRAMPLTVTVIDDDAERKLEVMTRNYPIAMGQFNAITCSTTASDVGQLRAKYANDAVSMPVRVYVTASDDERGVDTTLRLLEYLNIPVGIVVALSRRHGTAKLLDSLQSVDVQVFPTYGETCTPAMLFHFPAKAMAENIHENWRKSQDPARGPAPKWEQATRSQRESSMAQALDIAAKVRAIDCSIAKLPADGVSDFRFTEVELEQLAVQEHERWVSERRTAGWTDGVRDPEAKTTPYLVPFGELPPDIAEFDRVSIRTIPEILASTGHAVVRNPRTKRAGN